MSTFSSAVPFLLSAYFLLNHLSRLLFQALDNESESLVQRAIDRASVGRTTLTVAHRLSTIRNADRIFVLEDGRIKESGTHDELVKKGGRYVELIEAQL